MNNPEMPQGHRGRRNRATGIALLVAVGLLVPFTDAEAKTNWVTARINSGPGDVCVDVGGRELTYYLLDADESAVLSVRGPRRMKIITRYIFSTEDANEQGYNVQVSLDGRQVLDKAFTAKLNEDVHVCGSVDQGVASLRRTYVDIGTGLHEVAINATTTGGGRVSTRLFRESKRQDDTFVSFAPEEFSSVYNLLFESGSQSRYYHFDAAQPLIFTVTGPTTLKIYTRLDFDHTMNGSQAYALEVLRDGESWQTFHYHAKKLSTAAFVERPDILPGSRKSMRIPVPKGTHRFEIKCVRPEACGIAAQIRIPQVDISRNKR